MLNLSHLDNMIYYYWQYRIQRINVLKCNLKIVFIYHIFHNMCC